MTTERHFGFPAKGESVAFIAAHSNSGAVTMQRNHGPVVTLRHPSGEEIEAGDLCASENLLIAPCGTVTRRSRLYPWRWFITWAVLWMAAGASIGWWF